MDLPANIIKEYIFSKFTDYRQFNDELTVNSIFYEDQKKHMSINLESGLWQDFKCGETGNFYHLVSFIEGISYSQAVKLITSKLFDSPELLFADAIEVRQQEPTSSIEDEFTNFKLIDDVTSPHSESLTERLAYKMMNKRGLSGAKLYFCDEGYYANRLIIPYTTFGMHYYFQARDLMGGGIKYLNPSRRKHGVKAAEMLYQYNTQAEYIVITEGPLDALSLQLNGINATCTQGSKLSLAQATQLKGKKIIFSYDNDEPGRKGMEIAKKVCLQKHINTVYTCSPPAKYKDWNEYHTSDDKPLPIPDWVQLHTKRLDFEFEASALLI
jgi:DNA primase